MGKSLKGKELGTGISQRKDGLYQARFTNRFGKRQTIYAKSYTEITKKLRQEQYNDDKKLNIVDTNITLDEWFEDWLKICKKNCRDTTIRTYKVEYESLRPELGWRKLSTLNLLIVQQAFNELKSDSWRKHCKALLVDMLDRAIESELLVKNVATNIKTCLNNEQPKERHVLTPNERDILLKYADKSSIYPFIVLGLETGMRIGEILGLTWDCVDFQSNMIHVRKTLCYLPGDGSNAIYEFHPPKTNAGIRDIPMTKKVKNVLLKQKQWKEDIESRFDPLPNFEDLVFTSRANRPINPTNIKATLDYIIEKINNDGIQFEHFTPHCLRHTFATICIERGMNPKTLQKILGHTSLKMTMDLYCHVLNDTIKNEMSVIGEMA